MGEAAQATKKPGKAGGTRKTVSAIRKTGELVLAIKDSGKRKIEDPVPVTALLLS